MGKQVWVAAGIGVGLVAALGAYLLFAGKSATAGPYGGDVVPIDKGAGYAELVANRDSGEVMVHTWDKDLATPRPIRAKPVTIGTDGSQVNLEPYPVRGDPPGYCSRFYGAAEWMRGGGHHRGWLRTGDDPDAHHNFGWERSWDAGKAQRGMWEEMAAHRGMHRGMPLGEGHGTPLPGGR